jgi:hypothetical protein
MISNSIFINNISITTSDIELELELIESSNTEEVNIMLNIFFNQNNEYDSGYYSD